MTEQEFEQAYDELLNEIADTSKPAIKRIEVNSAGFYSLLSNLPEYNKTSLPKTLLGKEVVLAQKAETTFTVVRDE